MCDHNKCGLLRPHLHEQFLVISDRAKQVLVMTVPCHILKHPHQHTHTKTMTVCLCVANEPHQAVPLQHWSGRCTCSWRSAWLLPWCCLECPTRTPSGRLQHSAGGPPPVATSPGRSPPSRGRHTESRACTCCLSAASRAWCSQTPTHPLTPSWRQSGTSSGGSTCTPNKRKGTPQSTGVFDVNQARALGLRVWLFVPSSVHFTLMVDANANLHLACSSTKATKLCSIASVKRET